jgi:hypothetical protein
MRDPIAPSATKSYPPKPCALLSARPTPVEPGQHWPYYSKTANLSPTYVWVWVASLGRGWVGWASAIGRTTSNERSNEKKPPKLNKSGVRALHALVHALIVNVLNIDSMIVNPSIVEAPRHFAALGETTLCRYSILLHSRSRTFWRALARSGAALLWHPICFSILAAVRKRF